MAYEYEVKFNFILQYSLVYRYVTYSEALQWWRKHTGTEIAAPRLLEKIES